MIVETHMDCHASELLADAPSAELDKLFRRLRAAEKDCRGMDVHSLDTVLIHACIASGVNTCASIKGTLETLGLNGDRAVIALNKQTGDDALRYCWHCSEGVYRAHPYRYGLPD